MHKPSLTVIAVAGLVLLGTSGCGSKKARLAARGDKYFAAQKYDAAEVEYKGALRIPPVDGAVVRQLGLVYLMQGRWVNAYGTLKRAADFRPDDADLQAKLGEAALAFGDVVRARAAAVTGLKIDPKNDDAVMVLARASRGPSELTDARNLIEGFRRGGDRAAYHAALARLLRVTGKIGPSEAEARQAVALDGKFAEGYTELGETLIARGELNGATEALRTAAELSPLRSLARVRYIEFRMVTGKAAEAKADLEKLNAQAPDFIPGWVYAMQIAASEHRDDACAADVKTILSRDPGNLEALLEQGSLSLAKGDVTTAVHQLEYATNLYPRLDRLNFMLAQAYLRAGDAAKARSRLLASPTYAPAVLLLAQMEIRAGNAMAAVAPLIGVLSRAPQVRPAYDLLARAYLAQRNTTEAIGVYDRMARQFPKDPVPYFGKGLVEAQLGQRSEARQALNEALRLAPDYVPAQNLLVALDVADGHADVALQRARAMAAAHPNEAQPQYLLSQVELAAHDTPAAEGALEKAVQIDPKFEPAYMALARIYLGNHQTKDALDRLNAAVEKTHSVPPLLLIAAIHSQQGHDDQAEADYRKALTFDPHSVVALDDVAFLECERGGNLDEALKLATEARDLAPDNANVADTLGWIRYRRGDARGALPLLQEGALASPNSPDFQYHLGVVCSILGREKEAVTALQRATTLPGLDAAEMAAARERLTLLGIDPARAGAAERAMLEQALKKNPNDAAALDRLAGIQAASGDAAGAADNLRKFAAVAPDNAEVLARLAELEAGPLHEPAKAAELATQAHKLAPNDPEISRVLGRLVFATGDYRWAADLLEEAAHGLPGNAELQLDLARAYFYAGRVDAAAGAVAQAREEDAPSAAGRLSRLIEAAKEPKAALAEQAEAAQVLARDPNHLPALVVTAMAKEASGDAAGAEGLYRKVLAQDAAFSPALRNLARIEVSRGDNDEEAYGLALKAWQAFPQDSEVAKVLGIATYRKGDYTAAVRSLRSALQALPNDAEGAYYLGMCYSGLHEYPEARAQLQRALDLKLSGGEADDARRALDEMSSKGQDQSVPALE